METKHLPVTMLMKTVFRVFFIQAAWNYENFQGIGFTYALVPFLQKRDLGSEEAREFMKRHLNYFNTNPYLAGMIVGGTIRLEEERLEGRATPGQVEAFKNDLVGPLGALGDSLTWGALRPLAGLAAVLVAIIADSLAPLIFLVLYNTFALWLRVSGVKNGYAYGDGLLRYLKDVNFQKKIFRMNGLILFLVGVFLPLWTIQAVPGLSFAYIGLFCFMVFLVWAVWSVERKGVPLLFQVAALFFLSQLLAYMGWVTL